MKLLLLVVAVAAIVLVGAELVVPPRIESTIEERVRQGVPEAATVEAELGRFPVVARALATGVVQQLTLRLGQVDRPEVSIDSVTVEVSGIAIARRALLDGEVDLERIDRGVLRATVSEDALEEALAGGNVDLELHPGRVEASVLGQTVGSDVTVAEGSVRFDLGPLPDATVALPGPELFPCPLDGEVVEGAVRLTCTLDRVPDYLLRRIEAG